MNIDEKIQQELKNESKQLDEILAHEPGIFKMLENAFKGSLGLWMVIVGLVTFVITLIMFWAGYHFFFEQGNIGFRLHWGVVFLFAAMVQIALKMWSFMEMNRQSMLREVKRLELAVDKLTIELAKNGNSRE